MSALWRVRHLSADTAPAHRARETINFLNARLLHSSCQKFTPPNSVTAIQLTAKSGVPKFCRFSPIDHTCIHFWFLAYYSVKPSCVLNLILLDSAIIKINRDSQKNPRCSPTPDLCPFFLWGVLCMTISRKAKLWTYLNSLEIRRVSKIWAFLSLTTSVHGRYPTPWSYGLTAL